MKGFNKIVTTILAAALSPAIAGTMGPIAEPKESWYLVGMAGYSDSLKADIRVNPALWDAANQGYDSKLSHTAVLGFGVGRYVADFLRLDARYEHRGDYHYNRFQQGAAATLNSANTRTRYFDVNSNSVMVNGWLDLGALYSSMMWDVSTVSLQPFVGGGVGVNYLTTTNFRTEAAVFTPNPSRRFVTSITPTASASEFAWNVGAGLSAQLTTRTTLAVGYNYFDGGKLPFENYIISTNTITTPGASALTVTPWKGKLRANEVYAELRVLI